MRSLLHPNSWCSRRPHRAVVTLFTLLSVLAGCQGKPSSDPEAPQTESTGAARQGTTTTEAETPPSASLPSAPSHLALEPNRPMAVVLLLAEGLTEAHVQAATCRLYRGVERSIFGHARAQGTIPSGDGQASALDRVLTGQDTPLAPDAPHVFAAWSAAGHPTGFVSDQEIFSTGLSDATSRATPWDRGLNLSIVMAGGWPADDAHVAPAIDDEWTRINDLSALDTDSDNRDNEALPLPLAGLFAHGPFPPADTHGSDHPPYNSLIWKSATRLAAVNEGAFFLAVESHGIAQATASEDLHQVAMEVRELGFAIDGIRSSLEALGLPWTILLVGHGTAGTLRFHACDADALEPDAVFLSPPEPGLPLVWFLWSPSPHGALPDELTLEDVAWLVLPPEEGPEPTREENTDSGFCREDADGDEACEEDEAAEETRTERETPPEEQYEGAGQPLPQDP